MNRTHVEQLPNPFELDINPYNKEMPALKYSHPSMTLQSIFEPMPKRIQI